MKSRRWRLFISRVICFLIAVIILGLTTPIAQARVLSEKYRDLFSASDIVFWDPEEKHDCDGTDVTWIGDSISYLANGGSTDVSAVSSQTNESARSGGGYGTATGGDIGGFFPNAYIDAFPGRRFWTHYAGSEWGGQAALQAAINSGNLRDTIVYALGGNDGTNISGYGYSAAANQDVHGLNPVEIDAFKAALDAVGGEHRVVLVTYYAYDETTGRDDYFMRTNSVIKEKASEYGWTVADWAAVATPEDVIGGAHNESGGTWDVHPNAEGLMKWTEKIQSAVCGDTEKEGQACGCESGSDNFERIVNHFAGKISANGIAGILGNFKAESAFSPFRNQGQFSGKNGNMSDSNGYGIAQFTPRTKVLPKLKTDSRTASYFSQYYKEEYGGTPPESGVPEGVPEEVDIAWLCVQLDYIEESELNVTKVGTYRNLDGGMGLDYISDNMTITEALNAAQSPEDAARIFLWIYERPSDKQNTAPTRQNNAASYIGRVNSILGSGSCDNKSPLPPGDYVFPVQGATKSNLLNGKTGYKSALSPLPCGSGFCHHDYDAVDTGIYYNHVTESAYPDLVGKYDDYYWYSVGAKVIAITDGQITSYKPYSRAKEGYENRCASVMFRGNDGTQYWLGHMSYDSSKGAGQTFSRGEVIGEIGPPPCAINTQAHLHIDIEPDHPRSIVTLMDSLYETLPN